ncbi:hypothetical protein [Siccirubricoccus sp. G192]|uniref:hypothetical protein n=1 Tax=Siccirubricoccus sp. G192 TaxID=2849651 RepID=UPI001C2BE3B8|nr:hypothetical protein [Siccirubricoccus sp. G192]MBV1800475.1 hypothetical protein [Siccirubricoccus sp. G192]
MAVKTTTRHEAEGQDGAKSRAWAFLTRQDAEALEARAVAEGVRASEITLRAIRAYLATPLLPTTSVAELAGMVPGDRRAVLAMTASLPMAASAVVASAHIEKLAQAVEALDRVATALIVTVPSITAQTEAQAEIRESLAALADGIGTVAADVASRYGLVAAGEDGVAVLPGR